MRCSAGGTRRMTIQTPSATSPDRIFRLYTVGGITQVGITSTIPLLIADIRKDIAQNHGAYTNTFVALQNPSSGGYMAPTPSPGPRPIAHGPHLAVVIGPSGVDRNQEVYADAIGRVTDPLSMGSGTAVYGEWTTGAMVVAEPTGQAIPRRPEHLLGTRLRGLGRPAIRQPVPAAQRPGGAGRIYRRKPRTADHHRPRLQCQFGCHEPPLPLEIRGAEAAEQTFGPEGHRQ